QSRPSVRGQPGQGLVLEDDPSSAGRQQPHHAAQQRGLARAISADQPGDLTGSYRKRNAPQDLDRANRDFQALDSQHEGAPPLLERVLSPASVVRTSSPPRSPASP